MLHVIIKLELSTFKGKRIFELWNTKTEIKEQKQNTINNILMINYYFTVYRYVHFDRQNVHVSSKRNMLVFKDTQDLSGDINLIQNTMYFIGVVFVK